MFKFKRTISILCSCLIIYPETALPLDTVSITASSASPSCVDYKIVGSCFWLKCGWRGCKVRTSVKVKHYLPETVISAYNYRGQNPWTEANLINTGVQASRYNTPNRQYSQFTFKNADAIGHPQGLINSLLAKTGFFCNSQTTPFVPYFLSGMDFLAWNMQLPEMFYPEALIPFMREVGQFGDNWGNIYPRSGAINQTHDYKASAVVAQRVADIITRKGQPHLYLSTAKSGGKGIWYPSPVEEGKEGNHKWQMLYPKMSNSCSVFPDTSALELFSSKVSSQGKYAWSLWRPYSCCKKRGQVFLHSIDWSN